MVQHLTYFHRFLLTKASLSSPASLCPGMDLRGGSTAGAGGDMQVDVTGPFTGQQHCFLFSIIQQLNICIYSITNILYLPSLLSVSRDLPCVLPMGTHAHTHLLKKNLLFDPHHLKSIRGSNQKSFLSLCPAIKLCSASQRTKS